MGQFDGVNVSPNLKRLQRAFVNNMYTAFQSYIDESDTTINLTVDGESFVISDRVAAALFNDVLLASNDGDAIAERVKVDE